MALKKLLHDRTTVSVSGLIAAVCVIQTMLRRIYITSFPERSCRADYQKPLIQGLQCEIHRDLKIHTRRCETNPRWDWKGPDQICPRISHSLAETLAGLDDSSGRDYVLRKGSHVDCFNLLFEYLLTGIALDMVHATTVPQMQSQQSFSTVFLNRPIISAR
jgi:hypothetical protein